MSSREFLHTLWKEVVCDRKIDLSQNAELSDQALRLKNVCRLPLDIENPATCLDSGLPFLFEPLPPAVLRDHPLSEITLATMKFYDFCDRPEIPGEVVPRTLSQRIQAVCNYVSRFTLAYRPSLPSRFGVLSTYSGLHPIHIPNPFLLSRGIFGNVLGGDYRTYDMFEADSENGQPTHPHVILMIRHTFDGREGSMLYGELAPIISAMRSRAFQPQVEEHEKEALFENDEPFDNKPLAFPNEERFPVLVLSFLGPQHARILYACVHGGNSLAIHQSKLYSFEKLADAQVELFARFLVSKPQK